MLGSHPPSTPYGNDQCDAFIRLVEGLPNNGSVYLTGHRNSILARLWSEIDAYRFENITTSTYPAEDRRLTLSRNGMTAITAPRWWTKLLERAGSCVSTLNRCILVIAFSHFIQWMDYLGCVVSECERRVRWVSTLPILYVSFSLNFAILYCLLCRFLFNDVRPHYIRFPLYSH